MKLAVYPGTFDPFTLGHLDIAQRALRLFDQLVITVAVHVEKSTLLSSETRIHLIEKATDHLNGVRVMGFEGLVAQHAKSLGACALIRGLRTPGDFDYESQMAHTNRRMVPELDTVFFHTSAAHALTSSSLVRDILRWNGDIRPFVPPMIAEALMKE
ncbi:MAG: pantetheine-phosphate adenylyltransferase [Bacteroidetes bacterium]|nr:pantetheine-phosphate adenylyltransferase [Bacteroidota bacterium]MCY4205303.1 pantetheine-phosphate adenylyltransferase [Bacteroidota bacterium]